MEETVLITGASGLVGRHLTEWLRARGYPVLTLGRGPSSEGHLHWNPASGILDSSIVRSVRHVVHLAGAGLGDEPWTADRKRVILESRVESCRLLHEAFAREHCLPKTFVTASAVGYYGTDDDEGRLFTEEDGPGEGFLAEVCRKWESAADLFDTDGCRVVKLRTGIVLARDGGALPKMAQPVRYGLGMPMGSGRQIIPWIHLDDLCAAYLAALQREDLRGAYNAVAPERVNNSEFVRLLTMAYRRPYWPFRLPGFLFRWTLGEQSDLLLKGNAVHPTRLLQTGFTFRFNDLGSALSDLYRDKLLYPV